MTLLRGLSDALLFAFATRASLFLIVTATVGLRSRVFPRWLSLTGYVVGVALLLFVAVGDWVILVLPIWVAIASL